VYVAFVYDLIHLSKSSKFRVVLISKQRFVLLKRGYIMCMNHENLKLVAKYNDSML